MRWFFVWIFAGNTGRPIWERAKSNGPPYNLGAIKQEPVALQHTETPTRQFQNNQSQGETQYRNGSPQNLLEYNRSSTMVEGASTVCRIQQRILANEKRLT